MRVYCILDRCSELGIEVYRVHTDSFLIKVSDKNKLQEFIGEEPGQLVEKAVYPRGTKIIHMNSIVSLG
jgi:hypothetical protein